MSRAYYYTHNNGQPLHACPKCHSALTVSGGIALTLSVGGCVFAVVSHLDLAGRLQDTDDHAVAKGYHSETGCRCCGKSLVDYEQLHIRQREEGGNS